MPLVDSAVRLRRRAMITNMSDVLDTSATIGDDSVAKAPTPPPFVAKPHNGAPDTAAIGDAGDDMTVLTAFAHGLEFTLTVGQALDVFAAQQRKVPSVRSVQRYCQEESIAAKRIRTTYGQEWLINEASLLAFIARQPRVEMGDDSVAKAPTPPPFVAKPHNGAPDTAAIGDAGDDMTVPTIGGGETRTLAQVLIENAKLVERLDGKDALLAEKDARIGELSGDRVWLRAEVEQSRTIMAKRVFDLLDRMAASRLAASAFDQAQPAPTVVVRNDPPTAGDGAQT